MTTHYTPPGAYVPNRDAAWACGKAGPWSMPGARTPDGVTCRLCIRTTAYQQAVSAEQTTQDGDTDHG